jgi:peptidoglycan/xylan/chitin deacetylase (PgdA/CDA1 family)
MDELRYEWPDGKKIAAAVSVDFDGETPYLWRSRGAPRRGVGEIEQRRFGPREGIHRLLELFSSLDIRATVFVPGFIAEKYPRAVEKIAERGHEIGLHGYLHERVDEIGDIEIEETLTKARESIERIVGTCRMGYRSPSWERTEAAFRVLDKLHILSDSSLMGYDHPYWVGGMPEIPVQWLLDDAIFYRYTGGLNVPPPQDPVSVTDRWRQEFDGMKPWGGLFLITVHPWLSGRASRLQALKSLLGRLRGDRDVWWGTCGDAALHHRTSYPERYSEKAVFNFD